MKKLKRISTVLAAFAVMLCVSLLMTKDVDAAAKPKFEKPKIDVFLVNSGSTYFYSIHILNLADDASVTNVKSSKPSVFTVKYDYGSDYIQIVPVSKGKAVVSCTVKQNGKTYNLKKTIKVCKGNAFKNVKINGKQVYAAGDNLINLYTPKKNVKVSFKLKSGWKLKRMFYNYHNYKGKLMTKNYKMNNGDKVKIGKGSHTSVKIDVVNKQGEVFRYLICMYYEPNETEYIMAPAAGDKVLLDGNK